MPDNVTRSGRRDLYDHLINAGVIQALNIYDSAWIKIAGTDRLDPNDELYDPDMSEFDTEGENIPDEDYCPKYTICLSNETYCGDGENPYPESVRIITLICKDLDNGILQIARGSTRTVDHKTINVSIDFVPDIISSTEKIIEAIMSLIAKRP